MKPDRRGFLSMLLSGMVLDPERLFFVPGRKVYSIPRPSLSYELMYPPGYVDAVIAMELDDFRRLFIQPAIDRIVLDLYGC